LATQSPVSIPSPSPVVDTPIPPPPPPPPVQPIVSRVEQCKNCLDRANHTCEETTRDISDVGYRHKGYANCMRLSNFPEGLKTCDGDIRFDDLCRVLDETAQ
jgi:hypothetical protein